MKYEEIKEAEIKKVLFLSDGHWQTIAEASWEAHEALNLPVKFHEWCDNHIIKPHGISIWTLNVVGNKKDFYTLADLYTYWITEIYNNDKAGH